MSLSFEKKFFSGDVFFVYLFSLPKKIEFLCTCMCERRWMDRTTILAAKAMPVRFSAPCNRLLWAQTSLGNELDHARVFHATADMET